MKMKPDPGEWDQAPESLNRCEELRRDDDVETLESQKLKRH